MPMRAAVLIGLIVAVGCKKDPPSGSLGWPISPVSTAEQDALWKLAPEGATAGVVASPRGVELVERGVLAARAALDAIPQLTSLSRQLADGLRGAIDSPNPTLAELGLTHDHGLAVFFTRDVPIAAVLPVGDRDKFLARLHGTKGTDGDDVHGGVCKMIDGRYVCVANRAAFASVGHAALDAELRAASARGDVEFTGHGFSRFPNLHVAAVAQLAPGAIAIRGTATGVARSLAALIGKPSRPRPESAVASGFSVIDLAPSLTRLPQTPVLPGITLDRLGKSVAGPFTMTVPAGTRDLGIRVPLDDPALARTVIEHCTDVPHPADVALTVNNGGCHLSIAGQDTQYDAWVEDKDLRLGIRGITSGGSLSPSPLAAELAQNAWSAAVFGRGVFDLMSFVPAADRSGDNDNDPFLALIVRALPLVNELGAGIRKQGDAIDFLLGARTAWVNSDDVVRRLLAITPEQMTSGKAAEIRASIASAFPTSTFAQDVRAGVGGFQCIGIPIAVFLLAALPPYVTYLERSKDIAYNRIADHARRIRAETGEFPRGKVGLTPTAPCCGQPDDYCPPTPQDWQDPVWKALDFHIDEPTEYQYAYRSDGKTFTATAVGGLDCSGSTMTFELGNEDQSPGITMTGPNGVLWRVPGAPRNE